MSDIEQQIQDKGLTAPRVTPAQIKELMDTVVYHVYQVEGTTTTVATAVMPVGEDFFTLATEYSACASPENFDAEIGKRIACENAERKAEEMLWVLEGYVLKKKLSS